MIQHNPNRVHALGAAAIVGAALSAYAVVQTTQTPPAPSVAPTGQAAPATVSAAPAYLPDPTLTPGDVLTTDTGKVCVSGYTKTVRNVPPEVAKSVYDAYYRIGRVPRLREHGAIEIDHLVSLEAGGSNDAKNLWPEPEYLNVGGYEMGAHEKDKAENATHAAICAGKITIQDAQKQIATDWTVLYRRFVSPTFPKAKASNQ